MRPVAWRRGPPASVDGDLLSELREPLLTYALYDDFIQCSAALGTCTDPTFHTRVGGLNQLLGRLPPGHRDLLLHLVMFLKEVTKHAATCKMTVGNCMMAEDYFDVKDRSTMRSNLSLCNHFRIC